MRECLITSSVLIAVLIILRYLFRGRISRRLQYALWGLVLLRLLLPFPLLESPVSVMNAVKDTGTFADPAISAGAVSTDVPVPASMGATAGGKAEQAPKAENSMASPSIPLHILWLAGSIAVGCWMLGTNAVFYRRLKRSRKPVDSIDCRLPLYVSDRVVSPCLFGLFRPAVYLTAKAAGNAGDLRYVIAHELCHYRHGDHVWALLRVLCLAAYWWNPLVWAAAIFSCADGELACDEAVMRQVGTENRLAYGRALVDMIAVTAKPAGIFSTATTMASGRRVIRERLNMIIKNPKTFIPALVLLAAAVTVCVCMTFTGAHSRPLSAQEALDALNSSVTWTDDRVSFRIPSDYKATENWNISILGQQESKDGATQSFNFLQDVNDAKAWRPGMRYTIYLNTAYKELTLKAHLPGDTGEALEKDINLLGNISQALFDNRNPYIGDAPADGRLLNAMGISDKIGTYTLELETASEPFILRLNLTGSPPEATAVFNREMRRSAVLLLALIGNASEIQWQYSSGASPGGGGRTVGSLTVSEAEALLNISDLKSYGQSAAAVDSLLKKLQPVSGASTDYTLFTLGKGGIVLTARSLMTDDETTLANEIVVSYKAAIYPGVDPKTLDSCCLLRTMYSDGRVTDYYAYLDGGQAMLQSGDGGPSCRIDNSLYEELAKLTGQSGTGTDSQAAD